MMMNLFESNDKEYSHHFSLTNRKRKKNHKSCEI